MSPLRIIKTNSSLFSNYQSFSHFILITVCQQNGLSAASPSTDTSLVSPTPRGTNIPIPNSLGFYPPNGLSHPTASRDGSGLSHFGSPLGASLNNSLTSPIGHPLTSTPKSSPATNVASAPAARSAPTPKPKGFFRPYSTSPDPPKVSEEESQNVPGSVPNSFNVPAALQSPFSYAQHPAYRLPNTTIASASLSGGLIPQPGAIPSSFNGIRSSSYFPLDHNRHPSHHLLGAASASPFIATSGYPEYSLASSAINNNSPYYPNYPPRSLNGPSSSLLSNTNARTSSLGLHPSHALVQPNARPYHPPPEVNGSSAKTTAPCSTSTSTVPSHHQDLSCKSTHSIQSR